MAFGSPKIPHFVAYLTVALLGALGLFFCHTMWIRISFGVLVLYGILCLVLTNAWAAILPNKRPGMYGADSCRAGRSRVNNPRPRLPPQGPPAS
jgi:hypothetical protein